MNAQRLLLWIGVCLSLTAGIYACTGFIYYAWVDALEPDRVPLDHAAQLICGVLTIVSFTAAALCMLSLVNRAAQAYEEKK